MNHEDLKDEANATSRDGVARAAGGGIGLRKVDVLNSPMGAGKTSMTVGDRIRETREEAGYSQKAVADHMGKSRSAVAQWEGGHALPSIPDVTAMSPFLGVTPEYIAFGKREG